MAEPGRPLGAWRWAPPAAALLLGLGVAATGSNTALFHWFNGWSAWTGDTLWADVTVLGNTVFVFALLLPFRWRRPDIMFAGFLAAVPATLWADVLKPLLNTPRPAAVLGPTAIHVIGPVLTAHSFPSGHTTAIFTLAGVIALSLASARWRWPLLAAAALIGLARCVVGAHWPLDVLGGAFGGWFSAWAGVAAGRRWRALGTRPRVQAALTGVCLLACVSLFWYHGGYALAAGWARIVAAGSLVLFGVERLRGRNVPGRVP